MKRVSVMILTLALTGLLFGRNPGNNEAADSSETAALGKQNQLILWTSGDREVALKMVFMYSYYCKKRAWMDTVRLLVWGPSSKLLTEDTELQEKLKELKQEGVEMFACKACADLYGVSDKLEQLGVTVKYTGTMLADLQKQGWHVLSL
jgi:hypothetical protein